MSPDDLAAHYAKVWKNLTRPVRPSAGVLDVYREAISKLPDKKVLVLGATPELIDMAVELGASPIVSIEHFPTVIQAFRSLGKHDWSGVEFIAGDWLDERPQLHGAFTCVVCDGGTLFLRYPDQWDRLFAIVRAYLDPSGIFASRGWAEPPGERDYDSLVEEHIEAFNAAGPGRSAEETRTAFIELATMLRLATFVRTAGADGALDQTLLVGRADALIDRLEREFPAPDLVEINHAALKYLARSQPGTTDTVAGVRYDRAAELLKKNGFESRNVSLPDPPFDGSTYVFVARPA
jgi:hypothetical protein